MQVPLQTAPSVQLERGSEVQYGATGIEPVKDVVTDDIKRLEKAQQEMGLTLAKLDNELSDAEGKQLANDYATDLNALQNEYTNLKGANAVGTVEVDGEQVPVFEQYQSRAKELYESYKEKASSGTVQSIFGSKSSVYTRSFIDDITKHSLKQQRDYNETETSKEIDIHKDKAKTHFESWNNPNGEFRKSYAIGLAKIQEKAELKGWNLDPEKEDGNGNKIGISSQYYDAVEEYNMEIMKAVIDGLRGKNDFDGAKKFLMSLDPNGESKEINEVVRKVTAEQIEHGNSKCVDSIISNNGDQNDGRLASQFDALQCLSSNQAHDDGKGGSVVDGNNSNEIDITDRTQSENRETLDQIRSTSKFYQPDSGVRLIPQHQTTHLFAIQKLGVKKADSLYTKAKSSIEIDKQRFKVDPEYATEINKQILAKYNELIIEASVEKYGNKDRLKLETQIAELEKAPNLYRPGLSTGPPSQSDIINMNMDLAKNKKLSELRKKLDKLEENDPKYIEKIANDLKIITNGIDYDYSGESTVEVDEVTGLQPLAVLKAKLKATITDPKELATATKDLEIKYNKLKTEREELYNGALEKAQEIAFAEPGGWKNLKASNIDIDSFTKEDQEILRNGPPEESDIETVANLDANVDEVVNNLNAHRPKLSATQYLKLKQYAENLKGNESKYVEATGDNTLFKDTLYKNGYDWVYGNLKGENAATFHSIKTEWIDRIDYVQTHVEGRKLTREEKLKLLNNVLIDKVSVEEGILGIGARRDISIGEIINPDKLEKTFVNVNVKQENGTFKKERIFGSDIDDLVQAEIMKYLYRNKHAMSQQRIAEIWVKFDRPTSVEQFKKNVKAATLSLSTR